jgi:hypothetical protein
MIMEIMTNEQLMQKIDDVTNGYKGQIDHLYEAVGMIVIGRLVGWRVMRLVSSRRCWALANDLFGDPKKLMDEKGKYYKKSVALRIIDRVGGYWDHIKKPKDAMPAHERRLFEEDMVD